MDYHVARHTRQRHRGWQRPRAVHAHLVERVLHVVEAAEHRFDGACHPGAVADQPQAVDAEDHASLGASPVRRLAASTWTSAATRSRSERATPILARARNTRAPARSVALRPSRSASRISGSEKTRLEN